MLIVHTCCHRDHMTRNGIVHLDCWCTKILPLLGLLSALIFILWGFCPMVLFSTVAFLCAPTWFWLSTRASLDHMSEMGLYILIFGVLKYWIFWRFCPLWFLSFGAFVLWCFCPFWLFSVHSSDVDCPHLLWSWSHEQKCDCTPWLLAYQNIVSFEGFVFFDFYPLGLLSWASFVHWGFSLCTHVMLTVHTCCHRDHMIRNGIVHLDCWRTKILPLLGVFFRFDFYPLGLLSYGAFVHWGFSLCAHVMLIVHTCCHHDHMTRNGIVHLDCWCTIILPRLGILSAFDFYPLGLLSYGAFVHWGFSLCTNVMLIVHTCCDRDHMTRNGIVHLDCFSY